MGRAPCSWVREPVPRREVSLWKPRPHPPRGPIKRGLIIGLAVAVVVAVVVAYAVSQFLVSRASAPDFSATTTDGEPFILSNHLRIHPVVISFLSIRSLEAHQFLNGTLKAVRAAYLPTELLLLTIDMKLDGQDSVDFVNAYRQANGITWSFVIDDGSLESRYQVGASIAVFVVGKGQSIVLETSGVATLESIKAAVDAARRDY